MRRATCDASICSAPHPGGRAQRGLEVAGTHPPHGAYDHPGEEVVAAHVWSRDVAQPGVDAARGGLFDGEAFEVQVMGYGILLPPAAVKRCNLDASPYWENDGHFLSVTAENLYCGRLVVPRVEANAIDVGRPVETGYGMPCGVYHAFSIVIFVMLKRTAISVPPLMRNAMTGFPS